MDGFNEKCKFLSEDSTASDTLRLYADAASTKGFSAVFGMQWLMHGWPEEFENFHINILELFPVVLVVEIWGAKMSNQRILFLSDKRGYIRSK